MAKPKKSKRKTIQTSSSSAIYAKRTIFVVIIILIISVTITLVSTFFYDNEKAVKSKITELTKDYYENYFYEQLINSEQYNDQETFNKTMESYHTGALSPLTLRDLLNYDNKKNSEHEAFLTKYCDKNTTKILIFPDPPYTRNTFHAQITYSCNF